MNGCDRGWADRMKLWVFEIFNTRQLDTVCVYTCTASVIATAAASYCRHKDRSQYWTIRSLPVRIVMNSKTIVHTLADAYFDSNLACCWNGYEKRQAANKLCPIDESVDTKNRPQCVAYSWLKRDPLMNLIKAWSLTFASASLTFGQSNGIRQRTYSRRLTGRPRPTQISWLCFHQNNF